MKNFFLFIVIILMGILSGCASFQYPPQDLTPFTQAGLSKPLIRKIQNQEALTLSDLEELGRRKVPAAPIIQYLRSTEVYYQLTSKDFDRLRTAGVPDGVIDHLLSLPRRSDPYRGSVQIDDWGHDGVWRGPSCRYHSR